MAKTEDLAMRNFRKIRKAMNERLGRALREGRLEDELGVMERRAREWVANGPSKRASSSTNGKSRNGHAVPRKRAKRA